MPVYNQSRSRIIKLLFAVAFFVIIAQLFLSLRLYPITGARQMTRRFSAKQFYPSRGIIFDRHKEVFFDNALSYDLITTPSLLKNIDYNAFLPDNGYRYCIFQKKNFKPNIKNGYVRPGVFEASLSRIKICTFAGKSFPV
jgi:penicillin-binding protein 2